MAPGLMAQADACLQEGASAEEDALWRLLHLVQAMACSQGTPGVATAASREPVEPSFAAALLSAAARIPGGILAALLWRTIWGVSPRLPLSLHTLAANVPHVLPELQRWLSWLVQHECYSHSDEDAVHGPTRSDVATALRLLLSMAPPGDVLVLEDATVSDLVRLAQDLPLRAWYSEDVQGPAELHGLLLDVVDKVLRGPARQASAALLPAVTQLLMAQLEVSGLHTGFLSSCGWQQGVDGDSLVL